MAKFDYTAPVNPPGQPIEVNHVPKIVVGCVLGLFLLITIFLGCFTVDQGHYALIRRFGEVTREAEPGLHFKIPWIEDKIVFSIRDVTFTVDNIDAYSKDVQTSKSKLGLTYAIPASEVAWTYKTYGTQSVYEDSILQQRLEKAFKECHGEHTASEIIMERQRFGISVLDRFNTLIDPTKINVRSLQITNIDFSDEFEHASEAAATERAKVTQATLELEKKKVLAKQAIVEATAKGESAKKMAEGEAEATRLRGQAEADALRMKAQAFAENPLLVELIKAQQWNGQLPTTMIPNTSIPFLQSIPTK